MPTIRKPAMGASGVNYWSQSGGILSPLTATDSIAVNDNIPIYFNTARTKSILFNTATGNFTFNDDIMLGTNKALYLDDTATSGLAYSSFAGFTALWSQFNLLCYTNNRSSGNTAYLNFYTGTASGTANSGLIAFYTGHANINPNGNTGYVQLNTGNAGATSGTSGAFNIYTGSGYNVGNIQIYTGSSGGGTKGRVDIFTNSSTGVVSIQHAVDFNGAGELLNQNFVHKPTGGNPQYVFHNGNTGESATTLQDHGNAFQIYAQTGTTPKSINFITNGSQMLMSENALTGYGDWRDDLYLKYTHNIYLESGFGIIWTTTSYIHRNSGSNWLEINDSNEIDVIAPSVWLMPSIAGSTVYGMGTSASYTGMWNTYYSGAGREIYIGSDGDVHILSTSNPTQTEGGDIEIIAGDGYTGSNSNGGKIGIVYGVADGAGVNGDFQVYNNTTGGGFWADMTSSGLWTNTNQITLDETNGVEIEAGVANLTFKDSFLSTAIPISETGVTGLSGYTAVSIVGALNEVVAYITAGVASDTFITNDAIPRTVTVTNGIITNIA